MTLRTDIFLYTEKLSYTLNICGLIKCNLETVLPSSPFSNVQILFLQSHSLRVSVCEVRGDLDVTRDPF